MMPVIPEGHKLTSSGKLLSSRRRKRLKERRGGAAVLYYWYFYAHPSLNIGCQSRGKTAGMQFTPEDSYWRLTKLEVVIWGGKAHWRWLPCHGMRYRNFRNEISNARRLILLLDMVIQFVLLCLYMQLLLADHLISRWVTAAEMTDAHRRRI